MSDTTGSPFTATVRDTPAGPVVEAAGELDLDSVPTLRATLRHVLAAAIPPPALMVDLAAVTFCDSIGLRALLQARIEAERRGTTLRLANPTKAVARVLEITGTDRVFAVDRD
ncbi:STAS domain-containing protein [Kitasatospora indigofera]|uniref:STAS domain-containing protein n=1 Tax=Kitasatospora indigofera TaxID=67307 RepID=UPI0036B22438